MKLVDNGLIAIYRQFSELKAGWDGYKSKPIKKTVLTSIRDMSFISYIIGLFRKVGFKETDILVFPISNGNIQFEAESKNIYLEIEVDASYYTRCKKC